MSSMLFADPPPTIAEAIAELEREQRQRAVVYPRLIEAGKLTQQRADTQTRRLAAAIALIRELPA